MEAIVGAALWAIAASFAVGVVLAAVVFAVVRIAAPAAVTRHALWLVALLATGLAPFLIVGTMAVRGALHPAATAAPASPAHVHVVVSTTTMHGTAHAMPPHALGVAPVDASAPAAYSPRFTLPPLPVVERTAALVVIGAWALGALAGFAGLLRSVVRVRGLKRRSSPLEGSLADDLPWLTETDGREIYLRLSYETETPIAVGFARPVILIPTELATADGLGAIEPLVMHEHAHLRRYDDWTNLAQRFIERLFWFNPLVWLLGARVALEREVAADEAVVARTGEVKDYASALWRLAREMRMPEHVAVAPGAVFTRKQITERIERLVEDRPHPRLGAAGLGLGAFAATCVAAVAATAPALDVSACPSPVPTQAADLRLPDVLPFPLPAPHVSAAPRSRAQHQPPAQATPRIVTVYVERTPQPSASHAATTVQHKVFYYSDDATPAIPPPPEAPPAPRAAEIGRAAATAARLESAKAQLQAKALANESARMGRELAASVSADVAREVSRSFQGQDSPESLPSNVQLTRSLIEHCTACDLSHRNLHGLDLHGLSLTGASLDDADLSNANLAGARLSGASLRNTNLSGADLRNARLVGVELDGANFAGAKLEGMRLIGSSFRGTNFSGATSLRSLVDGCSGCDFSNMDLHGVDLHGITLTGANFRDTNLRAANLSGSKLSGLNFRGADLSDVNFDGATLNGCDLRHARLDGANLNRSSMSGSSLP